MVAAISFFWVAGATRGVEIGEVFEQMAWDPELVGRVERTRKVYLADVRATVAFRRKSPEQPRQPG